MKYIPSLIVSFLVCLFLFYIDEGRYTLDGILKLGNFVAMSIYFVIISGVMILLELFLGYFKKVKVNKVILLSVGAVLGTFAAISVFLFFMPLHKLF